MSQKNIFLNSEGDNWFNRNNDYLESKDWNNDSIIELMSQNCEVFKNSSILEIGCSAGHRLTQIKQKFNANVYGVDPSKKAIDVAVSLGIKATVASADNLPFENEKFDVVILGFCLYLCDRSDLFKIAYEVDRVIKNKGWIIILDFYSEKQKVVKYHHKEGINTFKYDHSKLFTWNPNYSEYYRKITDHSSLKNNNFTDDNNEMISLNLLRKIVE